jgi:hypothetical protein
MACFIYNAIVRFRFYYNARCMHIIKTSMKCFANECTGYFHHIMLNIKTGWQLLHASNISRAV